MKIRFFTIKAIFILSMLLGSHAYAAKLNINKDKELSDWDQRRVAAWNKLMVSNKGDDSLNKISRVNAFLNQIQYAEDVQEWGRKDYWATPSEFVRRNAGDCEDFAIAKYFTLVAMGVPESKLRIAYVQSLKLKQPHMVLYYYPEPGKNALVLDNLESEILPASSRTDLLPVYSFNKQGLWLINKGGSNHFVGSASRLSRWQEMLKRMPKGMLASL